MDKKKAIFIGCGSAFLISGIILVAVIAWVFHVGQDPPGVAASVEGPTTVNVEEEFTMTVVVDNQRASQTFELTDIDIAEEYLDHFLILDTNPTAKSSMHIPIDNTRSFSFDYDVQAQETVRFEFNLRATAAGIFRGDVDVCEGQRFLSALLQTEVKRGP